MCSYGQLSDVQMLHDLDLDLGSGEGHISMHNTCSTTSMPNHVTVVSLAHRALVGEVPRHRRADRPLWDGPTSAVTPRPL